MKTSLLPHLACPECRGPLTVRTGDTVAGEIESGEIGCTKCGRAFEIRSGVPDLLPLRYRDMPADKIPGAL